MLENYYEILELTPHASQEEIQKAYRRLVKKYHPDICPDKAAATQKMALLNQAYEILSDPVKRLAFDEQYIARKVSKQPRNRPRHKEKKSFAQRNIRSVGFAAALCFLFLCYGLFSDQTTPSPESAQATTAKSAAPTGTKEKANVLTQLLPQEVPTKQAGNYLITVINRQQSLPLYGRLWLLSSTPQPVKAFTIHGGEQLKLDHLAAGNYEIRYMYLYDEASATAAFKTQPFLLVPSETASTASRNLIIELVLPQPSASPPYPIDRNAL